MKNLTISVCIPAHNEERNIGYLLRSLVDEQKAGSPIVEVVVACDGCTDKTPAIVKKFATKYSFIKLLNDGKRVGKPARLNYFFKHHKGDILVTIDADTVFEKTKTFASIMRSFQENPKVDLIGTHDTPRSPRNFFESIVVTWILYWQMVTRPQNNWVNPHNCHGCMIAMRKRLSRKIMIPKGVTADDLFIFYKAQSLRSKFMFCPDAIVYFKAPNVLSDFLKQSKRFGMAGKDVDTMFPSLSRKYGANLSSSPKVFISFWLRHPVTFTLALGLQFYIRVTDNKDYALQKSGVWTTVTSSK